MKLTLYPNHIDDKIIRAGDGPTAYDTDIERAYLKGGELEASHLLNDWELGAAVTVTEGVDQDDVDLDTMQNNRVMLQAVWIANAAWQIGARSTLAAGRDKPDGEHRAGYGVHDVFASWTPRSGMAEGIGVHMGVDNVTDADCTPASRLGGPAPGRNFKLSLSRSF